MQQGNSWKYQNDSFPILSVERIPRSFLRKGSGSSCCGTCAKNISILKEKQLKSIDCRLEKERERERQSAIRRSVTGNEPHMPREEVPPVLYEWGEAQTQVLETGLSLSACKWSESRRNWVVWRMPALGPGCSGALSQLSILGPSVRPSVCLRDYCHCSVPRTIDPCGWQGHICVSTRELVSSLPIVPRLAFRALFSALPVHLCNILQQWDINTCTDIHTHTGTQRDCQFVSCVWNSETVTRLSSIHPSGKLFIYGTRNAISRLIVRVRKPKWFCMYTYGRRSLWRIPPCTLQRSWKVVSVFRVELKTMRLKEPCFIDIDILIIALRLYKWIQK